MEEERRVATREFDALAREKLKSAALAERVAMLENEKRELEFQLDRIKGNPIWKASAPARAVMHWVIRQFDRLRNQGSLRGVIARIRYKRKERQAFSYYGTESFPNEEQRKEESQARFASMVKISILTPLYNTPEKYLREMIESVQAQTYPNWELCLADGSDLDHAAVGLIARSYAENDERIIYRHLPENKGISGNTNAALTLAEGDFIALLDHDDVLHPSALYAYVREINEKGADYLYCDEATFKGDDINRMITMHFKPDYAIDNLRANNYICHFSMFRRSLLDGQELFRSQYDGSQDHDMILRLTDRAQKIVHIPRLLYYWRSHAGSTASNIEAKHYAIEAARGAVADHLRRHGFEHFQVSLVHSDDQNLYILPFFIRLYRIFKNRILKEIIVCKALLGTYEIDDELFTCRSIVLIKKTVIEIPGRIRQFHEDPDRRLNTGSNLITYLLKLGQIAHFTVSEQKYLYTLRPSADPVQYSRYGTADIYAADIVYPLLFRLPGFPVTVGKYDIGPGILYAFCDSQGFGVT